MQIHYMYVLYLLDKHSLVWRIGEEFLQLEVAGGLGPLSQSTAGSIKKHSVKASRRVGWGVRVWRKMCTKLLL